MEVGGRRKIGRPILRWSDIIRKDMKEKRVTIEEAPENVDTESSMRRPQIGQRPNKKMSVHLYNRSSNG